MNIYELAKLNESLYDLGLYENDDSLSDIDKKLISEYINKNQSCSKMFLEFSKYMIDNSICIHADYIVKKLKSNLEELYTKYKNYIHVVYLSHLCKKDKSNFFFTLYFCNEYKKKFDKNVLFISHKNKLKFFETNKKNENKILFIICDDFLYSGKQVRENIENLVENNNLKNYKVYLNIFGSTISGYERLKENFDVDNYDPIKNKNIIFPSDLIFNNNSVKNIINEFIKNKKITFDEFYKTHNIFFLKRKLENKYYIESALDNIISYYELYLIYIFYKFPDLVSTYNKLCLLEIYDESTIIFSNDTIKRIFLLEQNNIMERSKIIKIKIDPTLNKFYNVYTTGFLKKKQHILIEYKNVIKSLNKFFEPIIENYNNDNKNILIDLSKGILEKCNNIDFMSGIYNIIHKNIIKIKEEVNLNYCEKHFKPFYKSLEYKGIPSNIDSLDHFL
jgi:hypothetical protein